MTPMPEQGKDAPFWQTCPACSREIGATSRGRVFRIHAPIPGFEWAARKP